MYRCSDHNPIVTFIKLGTTTGIESPTLSRPDIELIGDPRSGYLTLVSNTDFVLIRAEIVNIGGQIIAAYDTNNAGNTEKHFTLPVKNLCEWLLSSTCLRCTKQMHDKGSTSLKLD